MTKKSLAASFAYWARNVRSQKLFAAIAKYGKGEVLDVGGRDFFLTARGLNAPFKSWTSLEPDPDHQLRTDDPRFKSVAGDGCKMQFADNAFDTVLNVQVLEHVFEPMAMVREISRVLKPSGHAIFLIPQTSVMHELPHHYYNFTRPWIEQAMRSADLKIVEIEPLGGIWSSMASHLVYFFFHALRLPGYTHAACKRNVSFYILFPVMVMYALLSIPVCLLLSLGDLTEDPNNHLVVARKPG